MDWTDVPWIALVAICIAGPWGVVLIVAMLRGYDVFVTFKRRELPPRHRRSDEDEE